MARHHKKGRRCAFESLENRRLLAGDVSAKLSHGNLIINGDKLDNAITILVTDGQISISGDAGSGTTINGSTSPFTIPASNFTGKLKIKMGRGDDSVAIQGLAVPGKAIIRLDKGDDTLVIDSMTTGKKASIDAGRGDDSVTITDSVFEYLRTNLHKGDDSLAISGTTASSRTVIKGGSGDDSFEDGGDNSFANLQIGKLNISTTDSETQPPTLAISGAATVAEGAVYTLSLSVTGSNFAPITQWQITWGDGSNPQVFSGSPASVAHTFADGANTYTVSATATNSDGTFNSGNTVTVTVTNVAPTLSLTGPTSITQGQLYTLNLSSSDPGADTISSWTINWGDGGDPQVVSGNPTSLTHTFANGPNTYLISATATDEDDTFNAGNTISVTVTTVEAPTLSLGGPSSIGEGQLYTLSLAASGPNADTVTSWTINWGDGSNPQVVSGNPASVTHAFADGPNSYSISATATDASGTHSASNTVTVTVNNIAPTLSISGATGVFEGQLYTLNLASSDPGVDTISSWTIHWGDGSDPQVVTGNPASVTHTFADGPNAFTISATAMDEDDTYNAGNTVTVTVTNVAPTLTITGPSTVNEGQSASWTVGAVVDPGADTVSNYVIRWGDGSSETFTAAQMTAASNVISHTYADGPNVYTIAIDLIDEDGTFLTAAMHDVNVANVAPTVSITGPTEIPEGESHGWNLGAVIDAGLDTVVAYIVHWGDGQSDSLTPQQLAEAAGVISHAYADGSSDYMITVDVEDEDGVHTGAGTFAVAVVNVPPTLAIAGPADIDEGAVYTLTLSASDPGADTIDHWTIDWGDGNVETVPGDSPSATHVYASGDNVYTINATATDEDGEFTAANTVEVTVHDVAPILAISGAAETNEGAVYTLNLSSTDPGVDTIDHWTINWGDGNVEVVAGNPEFTLHTYADGDASYVISATATDNDDMYAAGNTVSVTVLNVSPTVAIDGPTIVNEGESNTWILGNIVDPGDDTVLNYIVHWGDDSSDTFTAGEIDANNGQISHAYADGANNFTISIDLEDEDGVHLNAGILEVAVLDVAPTLLIDGPSTVTEGQSASWTLGAIIDPGDDTVTLYVIHWGEGETDTFSTADIANLGGVISHTYANGPNSYTITIDLVDEDGTHTAAGSLNVTVENAAPGNISAGDDQFVNEGDVVNLSGSFSDAGVDDSHTFNWHVEASNGQVVDDGSDQNFSFVPENNGVYTVTFTVTDSDGAANSTVVTITVANVPPALLLEAVVGVPNEPATLIGSFTDPGVGDSHTLTIQWDDPDDSTDSVFDLPATNSLVGTPTFVSTSGDGAILTITAFDPVTGIVSFSLEHMYVAAGERTIEVVVTDSDGSSNPTTTTTATIA